MSISMDIDQSMKHYQYDTVKMALNAGVNIMLVGPAGSGKTHLAQQLADELGLDFYFTGAVSQEHKLMGFIHANGGLIETQFRKAFTEGGLFLFDEIDASSAQVLMAFNAALASGVMDLPGETEPVYMHKDFKVIAAANTYGTGRDMEYVGRSQLDAATLDRFSMIKMDYDEAVEEAIARKIGTNLPSITFDDGTEKGAVDDILKLVRMHRQAVRDLNIKHVVSPRATIAGIKMMEQYVENGVDPDPIAFREMVILKGLGDDARKRIETRIKEINNESGKPQIEEDKVYRKKA